MRQEAWLLRNQYEVKLPFKDFRWDGQNCLYFLVNIKTKTAKNSVDSIKVYSSKFGDITQLQRILTAIFQVLDILCDMFSMKRQLVG